MAESKIFNLEIITPQEKVFEGQVNAVVAPAVYGYLGVLANHAPMISLLTNGRLTYRNLQGQTTSHDCPEGGVLEVKENQVTVLLPGLQN